MARAATLDFEVNAKQVAAIRKRLQQYQGAPLAKRIDAGALKAAQYLARPIRAAAPVGKTGNLRASVTARKGSHKSAFGVGVGAYAGPMGRKGAHRHLVIRGHRIVGHLPNKVQGGMSHPNPFVDAAVSRHHADAVRLVREELFKDGGF